MERKKEQAKVLSQEMLADGIYSLWIETEAALTARPGQFVSVYTTDASKLLASESGNDPDRHQQHPLHLRRCFRRPR